MESWRPRSRSAASRAGAPHSVGDHALAARPDALAELHRRRNHGGEAALHWIGFDNYVYALTDPDFQDALSRTLYFTIVSVGLETLIGVAVALLLNLEFKGPHLRPAC